MLHVEYKNKGLNDIYSIIDYNEEYGLNFKELAKIFNMSDKKLEKFLLNFEHHFCDSTYQFYKSEILNIRQKFKAILNTKYDEISKRRFFVSYMMYHQEAKFIKEINKLITRAKEGECNFTDEELLKITKYRIKYKFSQKQIAKTFNVDINKIQSFEDSITSKEIVEGINETEETIRHYYNNPVKKLKR